MQGFNMTIYRNCLILLFSLCCQALTAHALTAKNNLAVSVVVPAKVQLSATPMDFGTLYTTQNPSLRATANITVNMVATHPYHITLDAGQHKLTSRRMRSVAGNVIAYDLYQNAAYSTAWGDATYGNTYTAGSALVTTGTGANQVFIVYGQLQASPIQAGNFSDTITVTVHY